MSRDKITKTRLKGGTLKFVLNVTRRKEIVVLFNQKSSKSFQTSWNSQESSNTSSSFLEPFETLENVLKGSPDSEGLSTN